MELIAAITGESLLHALVWIIVAAVIYYLLDWLLKKVGLPEPFSKVATVVLALLCVLFLINAILTLVGKPFIRW